MDIPDVLFLWLYRITPFMKYVVQDFSCNRKQEGSTICISKLSDAAFELMTARGQIISFQPVLFCQTFIMPHALYSIIVEAPEGVITVEPVVIMVVGGAQVIKGCRFKVCKYMVGQGCNGNVLIHDRMLHLLSFRQRWCRGSSCQGRLRRMLRECACAGAQRSACQKMP